MKILYSCEMISNKTFMPESYDIKDINLSRKGSEYYEWANRNMPVLNKIRERFLKEKPLNGYRIAACLHVTAETANLVTVLKDGGADVYLCASNPLSTQDSITAYLAQKGINVYAIHNEDSDTYFRHANIVLEMNPHIVIDDGGDLTKLLHSVYAENVNDIIGGLEETTTGVIRVKNLEKSGKLLYPILAINDAKTKHMFDNRYGTGQSTIDSILRSTNTLLAGKVFVVNGYGMCGKGIAMRAKGLGADVIVTEVDSVRGLEATMDGFRVMPMNEAAAIADIVVSATGNIHIINSEHFDKMKDSVLLANAGHFDVEIDLDSLKKKAEKYRRLRNEIEEYTLPSGKRIIVLGEGRLVNLCAAEGHPSSVMDMSFANQALGCEFLIKNKESLGNKIYNLPDEFDSEIARLKLDSMGIKIDDLTDYQIDYMNSWEEGTK